MSKPVSEIDETGKPKPGTKLQKTVDMACVIIADQIKDHPELVADFKKGTKISQEMECNGMRVKLTFSFNG